MRAHPDRALVVAGPRRELVSSGASSSWHDLVLYLIGRDVGPVAAQAVSKVFALQRHVDGLAPFIVFDPPGTTATRSSAPLRLGSTPTPRSLPRSGR